VAIREMQLPHAMWNPLEYCDLEEDIDSVDLEEISSIACATRDLCLAERVPLGKRHSPIVGREVGDDRVDFSHSAEKIACTQIVQESVVKMVTSDDMKVSMKTIIDKSQGKGYISFLEEEEKRKADLLKATEAENSVPEENDVAKLQRSEAVSYNKETQEVFIVKVKDLEPQEGLPEVHLTDEAHAPKVNKRRKKKSSKSSNNNVANHGVDTTKEDFPLVVKVQGPSKGSRKKKRNRVNQSLRKKAADIDLLLQQTVGRTVNREDPKDLISGLEEVLRYLTRDERIFRTPPEDAGVVKKWYLTTSQAAGKPLAPDISRA